MKYVLLIIVVLFTNCFIVTVTYATDNTHSVEFDSSSSEYLFATNDLDVNLSEDLTIELWFKAGELSANHAFVTKWDSVGNNLSFGFRYLAGTNVLSFHTSANGITPFWSGEIPYEFDDASWYHLAVTFDASAGVAEFFVNGESVGLKSGYPNTIYSSTADINIGSTQAGREELLDGLVDEVRIWSKVRTQNELKDFMLTEVLDSEVGLLAQWNFNESLVSKTNTLNLSSTNKFGFSTDTPFPLVLEKDGLYTQIESPYPSLSETVGWANDLFAKKSGQSPVPGCPTIAACGCAITSLVMMARDAGVTTSVEGTDINPGTLNEWLIGNNGYNPGGILIWDRATDFFGVTENGLIKSPFRVAKYDVKNRTDIDASVGKETEYVMGYKQSAGHWFYITGLISDTLSVYDPIWYNTDTIDDTDDRANKVRGYGNQVDRGLVVSHSNVATTKTGRLQVTLESPAELLLVDEEGRRTGYDNGVLFEELPNSDYVQDERLQDQLSDIVQIHETKSLWAPDVHGQNTVHVIGTGVGDYTITFAFYDSNGQYRYETFSSSTQPGVTHAFIVNIDDGTVVTTDDVDDDENSTLDRAAFIALVEQAVAHEHRIVKKFFIEQANRIFDALDKNHKRLALVKLNIFEKLLTLKRIKNDELKEAIGDLRTILKE